MSVIERECEDDRFGNANILYLLYNFDCGMKV